jgi:hypothetical protein
VTRLTHKHLVPVMARGPHITDVAPFFPTETQP